MISASIPESLFSGTDTAVFSVNIDKIELKPWIIIIMSVFILTIIHNYNLNTDITHKLYDAINQLASRNLTSGVYEPNVSSLTCCSILSHNLL